MVFISCELLSVALLYVPVMVCCCGTGSTVVQYVLLCSVELASQSVSFTHTLVHFPCSHCFITSEHIHLLH